MIMARHEDVAPRGWPPFIERLIYYMLIPELFSKVIIETALGISGRALNQPKLFFFYGLVLIDYIISAFYLGKMSFRINLSNLAFMLFMTMVVHGLIVAYCWHNGISKVFTDTVPVLVAALNIALLNTAGAFNNFDFNRLQRVVWIFATTMISVGILAVIGHRGEEITFGGSGSEPICMSVMLVSLATKPKITVWDLTLITFIIAPTVPFINRTTLAVFFVVFLFFVIPRLLREPKQLYFSVFLVIAAGAAAYAFVPPDSKVVTRITGLADKASSNSGNETGGSIGERQAEWEAVNEKLAQLGPAAQYFGYGPGGVYRVQFTGGLIPDNYSHAHFSWALFKLRYGYIGFFYLFCYTALVLANLIRHVTRRDTLSKIVAVLDIWCLVYLFTYAFFNFLVAGLQFVDANELVEAPGDNRPNRSPINNQGSNRLLKNAARREAGA